MRSEIVDRHLADLYHQSVKARHGCFFVSAIAMASQLGTLGPCDLPTNLNEVLQIFADFQPTRLGLARPKDFNPILKVVSVEAISYSVSRPIDRFRPHFKGVRLPIRPLSGRLKSAARDQAPCIIDCFGKSAASKTRPAYHTLPYFPVNWTRLALLQAKQDLGYQPFAFMPVRRVKNNE